MIQPATRPAAILLAAIYLVAAAFVALPPLPTAVGGTLLPWHRFSEMADEAMGAGPFGCSGDERDGVQAKIVHDGDVYGYFGLVDGHGQGQFVIALLTEGKPARVWVGHSDVADNDVLVIDRVEAFDAASHGDSPCFILTGPKV
jgi:hypothetical protein